MGIIPPINEIDAMANYEMDKILDAMWQNPLNCYIVHFPTTVTRLKSMGFDIVEKDGKFKVKVPGEISEDEDVF